MHNVVIGSPTPGVFDVDRSRFEQAIICRFGAQAELVQSRDSESPIDVTAQVNRTGESDFQIFHFRKNDGISTDGTPEQALEVMRWIRSILPDDPGGAIWAIDEMYNGHVELNPNISEDDIKSGWVDHAESPAE
jgi:hypothetical protein